LNQNWRRKNNRLPPDRYVGNNAYLLTLVTANRARHFENREVVAYCDEQLKLAGEREGFDLLAYVFMPDHLHLLAQGEEASRLASFIKRFKQITGFSLRRDAGLEEVWQQSYFDRVVRKEEDLNERAQYIAANPARARIVSDWRFYEFRGGRLLTESLAGDLKVAATSEELNPLLSEMAPL
jgi:putative transposase